MPHDAKGRSLTSESVGKILPIRVSPDLIRKGLTIIGNWHYNLSDFPGIMKVIQESPLIDLLVSHVIPMSEIQRAFEISSSPSK